MLDWPLIGLAGLILGILVLVHVLAWGTPAGIILLVIGGLLLLGGYGYVGRGRGPR